MAAEKWKLGCRTAPVEEPYYGDVAPGIGLCLPVLWTASLPAQVRADLAAQLDALIVADERSQGRWLKARRELSLETVREAEAQDRAVAAELRGIRRESLSGDDRTRYDVFEYRLRRRLEQFRLRLYLTPFWEDTRFGPGLFNVVVRPRGPTAAASGDDEALVRRVEQQIELLREAMRTGMLPSKSRARWPQGMVEQSLRVHPRAYIPQNKFLLEEFLPACPDSASLGEWPNGAEVYRELVRRSTTTSLEPEEIRKLGLAEVKRIRGEMAALLPAIGYEGSLDDFFAASRTDPRFYCETEAELLAAFRAAAAKIEPLVEKLFLRTPGRVFTIEPRRGPGGPPAVYNSDQAVVFVSVLPLDLYPNFEIVPLLLHEGAPGHHLQFSLDRQSRGVETRRRYSAFTEGGALYAESLGEEMGLYDNTLDKFGQLSMDLMRAVRVVMDTGVHLDGWSLEDAKEYFLETTGRPEELADSEVARVEYAPPGSQLAYKIGALRFHAMRERAEQKLGRRFDLRKFHDAVLSWGPLPLDVLEVKVDECLAEPGCVLGGITPPGASKPD